MNKHRKPLTNQSGILKDLEINSFLQGGVKNTSWSRIYPLERGVGVGDDVENIFQTQSSSNFVLKALL